MYRIVNTEMPDYNNKSQITQIALRSGHGHLLCGLAEIAKIQQNVLIYKIQNSPQISVSK